MKRYLFRVQYTYRDGTQSYESVCVRAADDDESDARAQVADATARYKAASGAAATATLLLVTADA